MPTTARGAKSGLDGHSGQFVQANKPRFGILQKLLSTYQKIMTHLCLHSVRWNGQVPPIMLGTWHQASLLWWVHRLAGFTWCQVPNVMGWPMPFHDIKVLGARFKFSLIKIMFNRQILVTILSAWLSPEDYMSYNVVKKMTWSATSDHNVHASSMLFFLMPSSLELLHWFDPVCCWLTVVNVFYCSYFSEAKEHLERWLTCLWDSQCCWFKGPCALKQLKVCHCTFASPKVVKYLASICLLSLYIILSDFLVYSSWIFKKTQWNIEAIWGWRRKHIKRNYSNIEFAIVKAVAVYYHLLHLQQVTEDCLFFVGKEWNPTPWSNVVHLFIAWHCRLDCSIYYWMSSKWGTQLLQTLVV